MRRSFPLLTLVLTMACLLFGGVARAEEPALRPDAVWKPQALSSASWTFTSAPLLSWARLQAISAPLSAAARRGVVDPSMAPQQTLGGAPPPSAAVSSASPEPEPNLAPAQRRFCPDMTGAPGPHEACAPALAEQKKSKGLHHELWFATIEVFTIQSASIAIFAALPGAVSGFTKPDIRNIAKFASMGPHFDDDRWGFNYIGHPLAGSEYYLIARNRGAALWQGMLYAAAWSTFWEYVTEGLYERASIQDLIVTPVSGAVLGELRYEFRRAIIAANPRAARKFPLALAVIALDPIESIAEALPLRF